MFAAGWVAVDALTDVCDSLLTMLAFHLSVPSFPCRACGTQNRNTLAHRSPSGSCNCRCRTAHRATRVGHHLCLGQNCVLRVKDWCSRVAARFLHCDRQCFPLVRTRTAALVNHRLRSSRPLRAQARDEMSTACPARSFAASRSAKLARQSIGRESNTTDLEQVLLKSEQPRSGPGQNKLSWQLLRGKASRQVRRSIEERFR